MNYATWEDALEALLENSQDEDSEELHDIAAEAIYRRLWENGYRPSNGRAGAPSHLMTATERQGLPRIAASTTPDAGSNTFQGRALVTSWPSSEEPGVAFTVTVSFDSETAVRLQENLSGRVGMLATGEPESFLMTLIKEQPTT